MSLIVNNFVLTSHQENKWIIQVSDRFFVISDASKGLVDILHQSVTFEEALEHYNTTFGDHLSQEEFQIFLDEVFDKIPLLKHIETKSTSFITFQRTIFNSKVAAALSYPFQFLFQPVVFWLLCIGIIFIGYKVFTYPFKGYQNISLGILFVLYLPVFIIHEIGHVAACRRFTKQNGEIGFGIYLIFPVFYSNISAIWHGTKQQKVITNLAGVFLQMLAVSICFIILQFYPTNKYLYSICYVMTYYSILQLLPFIRSDGYWILSDLSSVHNLQEKSSLKVLESVKNINIIRQNTSTDWLILLYGIFNFLLIGYFIYIQIRYNWQDIIKFPITIFNLLKNLVLLNFSELNFNYSLLSILLFYIIMFQYLKSIFDYIKSKINPVETH